jgi:Melibiase
MMKKASRLLWGSGWGMMGCAILSQVGIVHAGTAPARADLLKSSGDAYVQQQGTTWSFGTAKVEKEIRLENGRLSLVSFEDPATHHQYIQGPSDPFRFELEGKTVTGASEQWTLAGVHTAVLEQGELSFDLDLRSEKVAVVKHFLLYPRESIIQEALTIKNISPDNETLSDPYFLQIPMLQKEATDIDFSYMTGGGCFWGSWILKTQPLTVNYVRHFDASDNPECLPGKPCTLKWVMGNSIYAPIQVYFNRKTKNGVFVGWDYLGRWASDVGRFRGDPLYVGLKIAGYKKQLAPGASIDTPWAFTGVFSQDLDVMGNQLLDYQYRYKWDYTQDRYFPAIQMLGYWWNGASDFDPKHPGMDVEPVSTFRKVFRMADEMRSVGADMYWRDYGWWDIAGDWNGPDFAETGRYLNKYGMKQTLYTIVYDAQQGSKVIGDHPDWAIYRGGHFAGQYVLDQSKPGVIDWELKVLQDQVKKWGAFEWRKDDSPLHAVDGDQTPMLSQDQGFRSLLRRFLKRNPQNAFHGCDGGGNDLGYEVLRMANAWQMSDGCVGRYREYYASYLFPPDKLLNMPDGWNPDKFNKAEWFGLLWSSFPMTGDTLDPAKNEQLRLLIDIYHYLGKEGVVGRWVKIYHPPVTGDTPDWYLERMSQDNLRGIIIPGHDVKSPIVIYPRGLLPDAIYNVSYQQRGSVEQRRGADLMAKGISFSRVEDGELIYLGLPMHPGSPADKIPPSVPSELSVTVGTHMDQIGVELRWKAATDNNWISYYEIYRNGEAIDKVAKGTFYFDHSAGADPASRYGVAAVDGSGNLSPMIFTQAAGTTPTSVLDDTSGLLKYSGAWKHERRVWSTYDGTQSVSAGAGNAVELAFEGNRIAWYGRLGNAMGRADVFIDGKWDQTVDAYDADEIPNFLLYERSFSSIARHVIRIVVRGDHQWRSAGNAIALDGLQVGRTPMKVVDNAAEGIKYQGADWKHSRGWEAASGKDASWTSVEGDSTTYTFRGNRIAWIGKCCPVCGTADVYLDGKLETTVDTYKPDFHRFRVNAQGAWQGPVFEKSWPDTGEHTIKIVVQKERNMLSRGSEVYLDSFQVGQP